MLTCNRGIELSHRPLLFSKDSLSRLLGGLRVGEGTVKKERKELVSLSLSLFQRKKERKKKDWYIRLTSRLMLPIHEAERLTADDLLLAHLVEPR